MLCYIKIFFLAVAINAMNFDIEKLLQEAPEGVLDLKSIKPLSARSAVPTVPAVSRLLDHVRAREEHIKQSEMIDRINKLINKNQPPQECPAISQSNTCGEVSQDTCWSPGSFDVDCRLDVDKDFGSSSFAGISEIGSGTANGIIANIAGAGTKGDSEQFGLCCFNGCRNECLQKPCKTIYITEFEEQVTTQCHQVSHEKCDDVTSTICNNVCRQESKPVTELVPHEVCNMVNKKECRIKKTLETKCTDVPFVPSTTCPLIEQQYNCPEPVAPCWSPGVTDVDCPLPVNAAEPWGLCCFDGCSNTCLDQIEPNGDCVTTYNNICKNMTNTVCKKIPAVKTCKQITRTVYPDATTHDCPPAAEGCTDAKLICNPEEPEKLCEFNCIETCKDICTDMTTYEEVDVQVEKCHPQPPKSSCHLETKRVCQPATEFIYNTNIGQKKGYKAKGYKAKGAHGIFKRSPHGYKGEKGTKGGKGMKGKYYLKGQVGFNTNCYDVKQEVCQSIAVTPICTMVTETHKLPKTVQQCKVTCSSEMQINPDKCTDTTVPPYQVGTEECSEGEETEVCDQAVSTECNNIANTVCTECVKVPKEVEECRVKPERQCHNELEEVIKMVPEEICEDKCHPKTDRICKDVPFQQCGPVKIQVAKEVPKEVCEW